MRRNTSKAALYENIMRKVSMVVKQSLNEMGSPRMTDNNESFMDINPTTGYELCQKINNILRDVVYIYRELNPNDDIYQYAAGLSSQIRASLRMFASKGADTTKISEDYQISDADDAIDQYIQEITSILNTLKRYEEFKTYCSKLKQLQKKMISDYNG